MFWQWGRYRRMAHSALSPARNVPFDSGVLDTFSRRTFVLVLLLLLQSVSSFVLKRYESLIVKYTVVPLFLPMLIGAGGNAGNQSAVRAITGLAAEEFGLKQFKRVLWKEVRVGLLCASVLSVIGLLRVYVFYSPRAVGATAIAETCRLSLEVGPMVELQKRYWFDAGERRCLMFEWGGRLSNANNFVSESECMAKCVGKVSLVPVWAISVALFAIILTSNIIGTALPFLLDLLGLDREHAGPTIQVLMDILGVVFTCSVVTFAVETFM